MLKIIIALILAIIYCQTAHCELVWGKYHNVNTTYCPNPDNLNDKYPKIDQTSLPVSFINGPYKQWCIKQGCDSYAFSTYTVRTPYVQALTGFRVEMEWEWNKPNYTTNVNGTRLNSAWCVYYNQNDCYYGGAEFGFCHYSKDYISFYAGCGYANMKNVTFNEKQIKLRWLLKPSSTEINYINMTAIANNTGYEISINFTTDNFKTITSYSHYEKYLNCLDSNFNRGVGKITGSADANFNIYTKDKITYKSIEYAYDKSRLTNLIDNLIG